MLDDDVWLVALAAFIRWVLHACPTAIMLCMFVDVSWCTSSWANASLVSISASSSVRARRGSCWYCESVAPEGGKQPSTRRLSTVMGNLYEAAALAPSWTARE